ncbi:MAG: hypothetical protein LUD41_01065 [Phascolarctobacterium sp.]|nr:hypothetical protein [Phascolarctobacterium sp.]
MKSTESAEELRKIAAAINRIANRLVVEDEKPVTLETVMAALVERSQNGHTAQVRALLKKYGALMLTDVDPNDYADILAEAEDINDSG